MQILENISYITGYLSPRTRKRIYKLFNLTNVLINWPSKQRRRSDASSSEEYNQALATLRSVLRDYEATMKKIEPDEEKLTRKVMLNPEFQGRAIAVVEALRKCLKHSSLEQIIRDLKELYKLNYIVQDLRNLHNLNHVIQDLLSPADQAEEPYHYREYPADPEAYGRAIGEAFEITDAAEPTKAQVREWMRKHEYKK